MSYFLDPEDENPVEQAHSRLQQAAGRADIGQVREILAQYPGAALGQNGWQQDALGVLASSLWKATRPAWDECVLAIVNSGANPNSRHRYQETFVDLMIRAGDAQILRALGDAGKLDLAHDWLGRAMMAAREGTSWRRGYRFADTVRTLLEAGVPAFGLNDKGYREAGQRIDGVAWTHLNTTHISIHPELLQVIDLLIEHGCTVTPTAVARAFGGGNEEAIRHLIDHCEASSTELIETVKSNNPQLRARMERIVLDARSQAHTAETPRSRGTRL